MICQWDSKFASLLCLWSIYERFPCSICGLSDHLLDGSFPDSVHSVTGAGYATHFWVDYAISSNDCHASAPPPDRTSFSKHLTHFMSHFLTTRYRPVSRFRNNSIWSSEWNFYRSLNRNDRNGLYRLDESTPTLDWWKWWLRFLKYHKWIFELNQTMASTLG
jgi:hypothetical protein